MLGTQAVTRALVCRVHVQRRRTPVSCLQRNAIPLPSLTDHFLRFNKLACLKVALHYFGFRNCVALDMYRCHCVCVCVCVWFWVCVCICRLSQPPSTPSESWAFEAHTSWPCQISKCVLWGLWSCPCACVPTTHCTGRHQAQLATDCEGFEWMYV